MFKAEKKGTRSSTTLKKEVYQVQNHLWKLFTKQIYKILDSTFSCALIYCIGVAAKTTTINKIHQSNPKC